MGVVLYGDVYGRCIITFVTNSLIFNQYFRQWRILDLVFSRGEGAGCKTIAELRMNPKLVKPVSNGFLNKRQQIVF